ncbi:MAG: hypothetical protein ACRCZY_06420 [Phocaeicola sp.]
MRYLALILITIIASAITVYEVADCYFTHHAIILNPDTWLVGFFFLGTVITGVIVTPAYTSEERILVWLTKFLSFSLINYMLFASILLLAVWAGSSFFWQYTYYAKELPYTLSSFSLGSENNNFPFALPYLITTLIAALIKYFIKRRKRV